MCAMNNPFYFREIPPDAPFCDRDKELTELASYAKGKANVVLYSPRRYGKTSLVKRVQKRLSAKGCVTIFADFFGVTSIDDVAGRLAKAVFDETHHHESLFKAAIKAIKTFRPVLKPDETSGVALSVEQSTIKKSGAEILDDTLLSLGKFVEDTKNLVHIALDEFQEIIELKESRQIEALMRTRMQNYQSSCFFIGSRRRVLLAMFNERHRPFFQSAINYELGALPQKELIQFIVDMFHSAEKKCNSEKAEMISARVSEHPYYSQKLAFFVYEMAGHIVEKDDIHNAFETLIASERPLYEAILQGLATKQTVLLKAIAREPSNSILSLDYMRRHDLGSTGGAQGALKRLSSLDLIEQDKDKCWRVVDPVFCAWLR